MAMPPTPTPRQSQPLRPSSPFVRYGLALLIAGVTVAIRWWLEPLVGSRHAFLGGNLAVALVAYRYGTGPAVAALAAIGGAFCWLFVVPTADFRGAPAGPLFVVMFSLATAVILVWLIRELERSRREAQSKAESTSNAEARLRERDTYLREFLDHTAAVVYVKDLDGRFLLVNNQYGRLFPDMKDDCLGTTTAAWFTPEMSAEFAATDARVIDTGHSQTFEQSIDLDDGEHEFVTVKFPILDDAGRIFAVGGVSTDVTELHTARADLERKERVLRNLIEIQEQEKQLLCGEFHDGLIQYAVGAKMMLESLPREILLERCGEAVDAAISCLARGIEDGRRVIHGIRPAELDDLGLDAAIHTLIGDLEGAGVEVEAKLEPMPVDTPPAFQVTVYRIIQEAFSNVRRHSNSPRAKFDLRRDGNIVVLRLEDFGNGGSSESQDHQGFGITGMQERARLVGGECRVEFRPGHGTIVTARLPLPATDGDGRQEPPADQRLGPSGEAISAVSAAPL
jgi:PAS domain S-box-containing protein